MSNSSEESVLQELKRISRLLALSLIADKTSQSEKIELLDQYGFQRKEIADLVGTNPNVVRATLSNIRRKAKGQKAKKGKVIKPDDEQGT